MSTDIGRMRKKCPFIIYWNFIFVWKVQIWALHRGCWEGNAPSWSQMCPSDHRKCPSYKTMCPLSTSVTLLIIWNIKSRYFRTFCTESGCARQNSVSQITGEHIMNSRINARIVLNIRLWITKTMCSWKLLF